MPSPAVIAAAQRNRARIGPYLIKHGNDIMYAGWYGSNAATVAASPFDGFLFAFYAINGTHEKILSTTAVTYAEVKADLQSIGAAKASFGSCNRYLPRILYTTTTQPDYYNDTHWNTIAQNFANLAQAAKEEGCFGLCLDNEFYPPGGNASYFAPNLWDWGNNTNNPTSGAFGDSGSIDPTTTPAVGATPGVNLANARIKVQARGKQVMDAVLAVWPNCRIITFYGPYISSTLTGAALNPPNYNDIAFANELMGTFAAGIAESVSAGGGKGIYYDGGEVYGCRNKADFRKLNTWRKRGLLNSATGAFNSTAKTALKWKGANAVGIYDRDITTGGFPVLSRDTFVNLCRDAMQADNELVWTYTEQYDWWGGGFPATPVPSDWKTAMSTARARGRL